MVLLSTRANISLLPVTGNGPAKVRAKRRHRPLPQIRIRAMPYFNARLLLILVTAASIISIFWYMASSSPVARQGLTVMDDQRADDDWRFRLAPQEGAATDDAR